MYYNLPSCEIKFNSVRKGTVHVHLWTFEHNKSY